MLKLVEIYIYLSIYIYLWLPFEIYFYLSMYNCDYLSKNISIYEYIFVITCRNIYLYMNIYLWYLSKYIPIYLYIFVITCRNIYLSIYIYLWLPVSSLDSSFSHSFFLVWRQSACLEVDTTRGTRLSLKKVFDILKRL